MPLGPADKHCPHRDLLEIKNAHVAMFKGEKQLRLGKNGTITILEKPIRKLNLQTINHFILYKAVNFLISQIILYLLIS